MTADYYENESIIIYYKDGTTEYEDLIINKCYINNEMIEINESEFNNIDIISNIIDKKNNEAKNEYIYKDAKWKCRLETIYLIKKHIKDINLVNEIVLSRYYYV